MLHHGRRAALASSAATPDPQFNYVTMLLHGDGTNGAQNNTFLDSSSNNFTITRNGNTTQGTFSPYGDRWSNYFGSTGSYLSVPYSSDFNLTGDFTIELWINPTTLPVSTGSGGPLYCRLFSFGTYNAANSFSLEINSTGSSLRQLYSWYNSTAYPVSANNAVTTNSWQHIAVVRSGTTISYYVNGIATGTTITGASAAINTSQSFYIANLQSFETTADVQYLGYISNFSILKGTAKYTGNFTPSTTPLAANATNQTLLTCTSNKFFDANTTTTAKTVTANGSPSVQRFNPFGASTAYSTSVIGGSGYFDGTGDALTLPVNSSFDLGTNACCIEAWVNLSNTNEMGIFCTTAGSVGQTRPNFTVTNTKFQVDYFNTIFFTGSITIPLNSWNHIAFTRSSTNGAWRFFLNGVLQGYNATGNQNLLQTTVSQVVGYFAGVHSTGYVTDLRITNGSVPTSYQTSSTTTGTSIFTPPSSPVTTSSQGASSPVLLLGMTNAAIYDNAAMNNLETVGNAQISTSVVKYGTGSLKFDGTGDYLNFKDITLSGDFTLECWLYPTSLTGTKVLFGHPTQNIQIPRIQENGGIYIYCAGTTVNNGTSSSALSTLNTWHHLAITRVSGVWNAFIDGVAYTGSAFTSYSADIPIAQIGTFQSGIAYDFPGYIDDLRITKGYARYTTNFTPPTAAFPNIGPT